MKRNFMFILLFLSLPQISVQAQKLMIPDNYLGLNVGSGLAVFNTNLNIEYPMYFVQVNNAALIFRTFESQRAALQIEAGFTQKGGLSFYDKKIFDTDTAGMPAAEYFELKTQGVNFTGLTHLAFGSGKSKFLINFGPYAYYLLDRELNPVIADTLTRKVYPDKNFDFGIKAGVGYSLNLNRSVFELELRYAHGFINIYENGKINNALVNQNQVLIVKLLYLRKLKK